MKIIQIITGLETGGAETMLYKLTTHMNRDEFCNRVISLTHIGPIGEKIRQYGIPVESLGMTAGLADLRHIVKLASIIRQEKPDLVQTWLYHADLVGGIAAKMAGIPVVWNIRQSDVDPSGNKKSALWSARFCAKFSKIIPAQIVCCSNAAKLTHIAFGYDQKKMQVIPNGFDLEDFCPDRQAYESVRSELDLGPNALIIGHVARFHPMKDHANLLAAAAMVHRQHPQVHFLLCGDGVNNDNQELLGLIKRYGVARVCHLLGRRDDVPRLTAAFDIACLSSSGGEGFPNVIGEAMACEVPCVVTDVGDSASIVAETGLGVPPRNPVELASSIIRLIEFGAEERRRLGMAARQRVIRFYSLPDIVRNYEQFYKEVIH